MLESFRFHHIGVAVKNIEKTTQVYVRGGYVHSRTIFDPIQQVNICWLTKQGMPTVELIEPANALSPVRQILGKSRVTPYHTCYAVDDINTAIAELCQQSYVLVKRPVEATAMNGCMICFMYNKDVGLIELVEKKET